MMIVTSIIAILASIGVPIFQSARLSAQNVACISDLRTIGQEVDLFRMRTGQIPDALADIGMDRRRDPWGHPYVYLRIDGGPKGKGQVRKDHNLVPLNTDFDLYSCGPDGKSQSPLTAAASRDDVIRAQNGDYLGLAIDY